MKSFKFSSEVVKAIKANFKSAAKSEAEAQLARKQAGQKMVDALTIACDMGDKGKYWKQSKALEACTKLFTACGLSESSIRNYPKSVRLAFIHGVPFQTDLFTTDARVKAGIPTKSGDTKADNAKKAGKVTSTTREALDATLNKALAQARMLGLNEFAATMLDHCIESLDGFKESKE